MGEFTHIRSLATAQQIINPVDHKAGILVNLMHLNRAGEDSPNLDDEVFFIQACDFLQSSKAMKGDACVDVAVDSRCNLGEGEASLIDLHVSFEIRSRTLREKLPDPVAGKADS